MRVSTLAKLARILCWVGYVVVTAILGISGTYTATAQASGIEIVTFKDVAQEQRYAQLIRELRCLVCQNQTLADSNADLAQDMRSIIHTMVLDGATNEQIITFLTQRYGDFIRYRPPVQGNTLLLWVGPFILVVGALGLVPMFIRRRRTVVISNSQRSAADHMLNSK